MKESVFFFKNGVFFLVDEARPFGTLFARRGRGRIARARAFRFPAIVRAVGYMVHLSSSLSRRLSFFFFPVAGVKRHGGLRVAPELERIAVAAHACCLAPIAPTNLAILPRAGNSPG
tara:strand:+ start:322 stop:672 length:351 start_codon:yes stop_codon:yes gene_type:complete